jgi:hypothetical protein
MKKRQSNKFRVLVVGGVLALAMVSAPANADHDYSIVVPAVAFIALSSIYYYNHHRHHYHQHYQRRHYGYQPRHSSSYGGYRNPKRNHNGHGGKRNQKRSRYSRY